MGIIDGTDLDRLLDAETLTAARAVSLIEQVSTALDAAHRAGLVHRDVKPSNILIGARDFAYLIDFGLARTVGGTQLTSAGQTMGTLAYMAPERFETGTADPRSDVYSLTCVLYQCLTRQRPFGGDTLEQQLKGLLLAPAPRPSTLNAEIGPAFDDVIAIGMAKQPEQRYGSAPELAAAARDALHDTSRVALTATLTQPALSEPGDDPTIAGHTDPTAHTDPVAHAAQIATPVPSGSGRPFNRSTQRVDLGVRADGGSPRPPPSWRRRHAV
jgi:serine/threonine protein kinase